MTSVLKLREKRREEKEGEMRDERREMVMEKRDVRLEINLDWNRFKHDVT